MTEKHVTYYTRQVEHVPMWLKADLRIFDWLLSKGFAVEMVAYLEPKSFVPGVWLDKGKLVINPQVASLADVLHEAGHLACIPHQFRKLTEPGDLLCPRLAKAIEDFCESHPYMDAEGNECPIWRGILQMGDAEATAWSFAASRELKVTKSDLYEGHDERFQGEAKDIWSDLESNAHLGIHGLQAAGFCNARDFPAMKRWL